MNGFRIVLDVPPARRVASVVVKVSYEDGYNDGWRHIEAGYPTPMEDKPVRVTRDYWQGYLDAYEAQYGVYGDRL